MCVCVCVGERERDREIFFCPMKYISDKEVNSTTRGHFSLLSKTRCNVHSALIYDVYSVFM